MEEGGSEEGNEGGMQGGRQEERVKGGARIWVRDKDRGYKGENGLPCSMHMLAMQ